MFLLESGVSVRTGTIYLYKVFLFNKKKKKSSNKCETIILMILSPHILRQKLHSIALIIFYYIQLYCM